MSMCCCPGCIRNDEQNDNQLYFERMDDDTWVVVCDKHADHESHATITLTDEVKQIPTGTLTQIVADLR